MDPEAQLPQPVFEEFCTCESSDFEADKCLTCLGRKKRVVEVGVTCDKGDELVHRIVGDNEPN